MSWLFGLDGALALLIVGIFVAGRLAPPVDDYADQERARMLID